VPQIPLRRQAGTGRRPRHPGLRGRSPGRARPDLTTHEGPGDLEYRRGVGFGFGSASEYVKIAVWKYFKLHVGSNGQYVDASELLIAAATNIADAFGTADDLSVERLQDIDGALHDAVIEAAAVRQTAADDAQRRANEQRLARLERDGAL
jgi:hypothetical protein